MFRSIFFISASYLNLESQRLLREMVGKPTDSIKNPFIHYWDEGSLDRLRGTTRLVTQNDILRYHFKML